MNVLPPLITDDTPPDPHPCYVCRAPAINRIGRYSCCDMHWPVVHRLADIIWKPYRMKAEDRINELEESLRDLQVKYTEALKQVRQKSSVNLEDEWYMQKGGVRPTPLGE